ncbi:MAG: DUF4136 domain-containing protein [Nitrospirota bacterium]
MNHDCPRRWLARAFRGMGLLIVGLLPILGGCYPYDRENTSDYDVVATTFDPGVDFSGIDTYSMPDEVRVLEDPDDDETVVGSINPQVEQAILNAIEQNMSDYGYTRVANNPDGTAPAGVDVHITPFALETTWVGGSCYPYYWDWYYGGSGWCYPVYYSYTTGTVVIPMTDPALPVNSEPIWIAGINGIISTASSNAARVGNAIDDAFSQSPYLDRTP